MNKQFDKVRRADRQETETGFLYGILSDTLTCSVAVSTPTHPLLHSTFFAFDHLTQEIIFHFSKYGFAGEQILDGREVTISGYKYGKLYTAEKAVDFGGEYQSVIVYGKIRIISEEQEKLKAMEFFFDRFFPHIPKSDYKNFTPSEANPISVAKVKIDKWFGKEHRVPDKATSAFYSSISPML